MEKNVSYITKYKKQSKKILDFLNSKGILDMDAHWGNYLVDSNENLYLTDFGLVLNKNFLLDSNEIAFMKRNKKIPYYYSIESLYTFLYWYIQRHVPKIKELFNNEIKKYLGKINFAKKFIKLIDYIIKVSKLPKIYGNIIKEGKNKIIYLIELKKNIINNM
jgi:predicted unusual protein kinase regulating ubiquinone biosynthesis (AarF/ABC1/UbiB family)